MRSGTGVPTPSALRLGAPVRVFPIKRLAAGNRVQDLLDLAHTRLIYPILSIKGLEGEFVYEPWDPASYKNGFGDFGKPVSPSQGAAGEYVQGLSRLPALGAGSVFGVIVVGSYEVPVAWTATESVGIFLPSGHGSRLVPGVATGVLYRGPELAGWLLKAAGR